MAEDAPFVGSQMHDAKKIRTATDRIVSETVQAEAMVTHTLPPEEPQRGFDIAATKADGAVKVVGVW